MSQFYRSPLPCSLHPKNDVETNVQEKSKSQRKREMLALQELAVALCQLPVERLNKLPLTDTLMNAMVEMGNVRSHEGKRRQMQYLGKLIRCLDDHIIAAIRTELDIWTGNNKAQTAQLHYLERWRIELINDDSAMTRLLNAYPNIDTQMLRTLVRNARKEMTQNKPSRYFRELFHILKQLEQLSDRTDLI